MMKKLQKLGKALMLPVAALPICGILMGLGYAIAPGVMGVPGAATSGALYNIGFLLVKAGGALIDNMAWLFVIGVAVGLSDDRDGTSALAGLVSWLMMTNLLSTGVVTTLMPAIADDPVKTLAFDKIQNVFIAIIAGIIGSACYNRFKNAKLPDWLAFFSGKRCVAIVTGLVSIVVSVVLPFCCSSGRSSSARSFLSAKPSSAWTASAQASTHSSTACSSRPVCTTHSTTYSGSIPSASATCRTTGPATLAVRTALPGASACICPASSPA
jgi:hypothetical protein